LTIGPSIRHYTYKTLIHRAYALTVSPPPRRQRMTSLNTPSLGDPLVFASALAAAATATARLDQAVSGHPLAQAVLYRSRLEAARRQASVDGRLIDPWHLAATIEGLRLRMDPYLRIIDRGQILEAARTALDYYQWLVAPDFDQEGEVQRAAASLTHFPPSTPPLLVGALGVHAWLEAGERRAPIRAALVRYWRTSGVLRMPLPLTGAAALRSGQTWTPSAWLVGFLGAVADEAVGTLNLLFDVERRWFTARQAVAGRRRGSHDSRVVDLLAATSVASATTVARLQGIAVKNAIRILDGLVADGIAIEVTHRSKRRLFALTGLDPLREVVHPPSRPEPGRGRGRPTIPPDTGEMTVASLQPPLTPVERKTFDYSALEDAMAHLDVVVRRARQTLDSTHVSIDTSLPPLSTIERE
jgi:hypothetical protein